VKVSVVKCQSGELLLRSSTNLAEGQFLRLPERLVDAAEMERAIPRADFEPTPHSKVCEVHFRLGYVQRELQQYNSTTGELLTVPCRAFLKKEAVPSIFS
jgi:hypothetical protein